MSQKNGRLNEKKVQEWLEEQGYNVYNMNEKGFPDLLVLKEGRIHFFVEVKGGRHKVHPHQREFHNKLEKLSGIPTKNYRITKGEIIEEN